MRHKALLYISFSICVAACNITGGYYESYSGHMSPEKLLNAQITTNAQEEETYDPLKAHMNARKQVSPSDRAQTAKYTSRGPAPNEPVHIRTIRVSTTDINKGEIDFMEGDKDRIATSSPPIDKIVPKPFFVKPAVKPAVPDRFITAVPEKTLITDAAPLLEQEPTNPASPESVVTPPTKPSLYAVSIEGLRIGNFEGKTRLVFDLSAPATFTHTLENTGTQLSIDIKEAGWSESPTKFFPTHPLLKSYTVRDSLTGGSIIQLNLKKPAGVTLARTLPAADGKSDRIVIDLEG